MNSSHFPLAKTRPALIGWPSRSTNQRSGFLAGKLYLNLCPDSDPRKNWLAKKSKIIHSNVSVLLGYIKSIWSLNIYFMFLLLGLFLAAMVLGLRGIYFITMKASHVDGPVWNISAVCLYFAITNKIMGIYYGPSRFLCLPREKKTAQ